ncbi:unnamed protein product [Lymnaea stagnalis]|uniref:Uncharacterized protein n=1 Tax=Lymnaea stagnalis TaxID=6523 RepID=A0AAV2HBL6_LYMST
MGQLSSRQEIIHMEVGDPLMRNWLCANMAIRDASKHLAMCVHFHISQMYKKMRRTIGASVPCSQNCSKLHDGRMNFWCTTCERWRKEILAVCDSQYKLKICWSRLNSSQWPTNPYEVARVFIPRAHRLYYKSAEFHEDFRFTLSFIENYNEIFIPRTLCEKAWQCRGRIKRKNLRMRLNDHDLQTTISVLVHLLSILDFEDTEPVIQNLEALLNSPDERQGCTIM